MIEYILLSLFLSPTLQDKDLVCLTHHSALKQDPPQNREHERCSKLFVKLDSMKDNL